MLTRRTSRMGPASGRPQDLADDRTCWAGFKTSPIIHAALSRRPFNSGSCPRCFPAPIVHPHSKLLALKNILECDEWWADIRLAIRSASRLWKKLSIWLCIKLCRYVAVGVVIHPGQVEVLQSMWKKRSIAPRTLVFLLPPGSASVTSLLATWLALLYSGIQPSKLLMPREELSRLSPIWRLLLTWSGCLPLHLESHLPAVASEQQLSSCVMSQADVASEPRLSSCVMSQPPNAAEQPFDEGSRGDHVMMCCCSPILVEYQDIHRLIATDRNVLITVVTVSECSSFVRVDLDVPISFAAFANNNLPDSFQLFYRHITWARSMLTRLTLPQCQAHLHRFDYPVPRRVDHNQDGSGEASALSVSERLHLLRSVLLERGVSEDCQQDAVGESATLYEAVSVHFLIESAVALAVLSLLTPPLRLNSGKGGAEVSRTKALAGAEILIKLLGLQGRCLLPCSPVSLLLNETMDQLQIQECITAIPSR